MREEKADLLRRVLRSTGPMSPEERRAWWFFERRINPGREPLARHDSQVSADEEEALEDLRAYYFDQQKRRIASLHARYPHLPIIVRAIEKLDAGDLLSWGEEARMNDSLRDDLARRKRHHGRMLDYLTWRKDEIATRKRNMGRMERLLAPTTRSQTSSTSNFFAIAPTARRYRSPRHRSTHMCTQKRGASSAEVKTTSTAFSRR